MNLASAFAASVEKQADKPALFWGDMELSYRQLHQQTRALARELIERFHVKPGDRVALWLKNCPEFVPALFGTFTAGAVAVPINTFLKPYEVAYMLQDAGVNVLVTDSSFSDALPALQQARPGLRTLDLSSLPDLSPGPDDAFPNREESDLAVIIYTSGTTGRPKGAMLSHGNLLDNVNSCRLMLEAESLDRFAVLLPMFHSFMLCVGVCLPLLVGGSMVLVKSLHPPKSVLQEILSRNATILPAIPQFFRALCGASLPAGMSLRLCVSGAAPLPVEILNEFNSKFPIPLLEGYGLSEASPVVSMNPIHGPWKAGSIGVPVPNVEVTIRNEQGKELPVGEIGELCVRGRNVMQGYWNLPEATAEVLRDGWLYTGDLGHKDADGYFFITDRKKDMLLVNGINVYPREIEELLYQFPGIKEAAVIGIPDARKGQQPMAFVAPAEGVQLEEQAIAQFIRSRLADYKVPRHVRILKNLPRNATGKVLKTELRALAEKG